MNERFMLHFHKKAVFIFLINQTIKKNVNAMSSVKISKSFTVFKFLINHKT